MWGGEALNRLASAVGLRRRQVASSVCLRNVAHGRGFSLSSKRARADVPSRFDLRFSSPALQHIVDPTLLPPPVRPPIPAYEHVPVALVARYLAYSSWVSINPRTWITFQVLFAQAGLDVEVRQFAGCWISLYLTGLIDNHSVGDPLVDDHQEVVVGVMGDGLFGWLFGPNQNENQVAALQMVDQVDDQGMLLYIVILPFGLMGFLMFTETHAFPAFIRVILGFIVGDWIFPFLPLWSRILILLGSVLSVTHSMMQDIIDWTWDALKNHVRNYVRNKVTKFYASLFSRTPPPQPRTWRDVVLCIHEYWRSRTDVISTEIIQRIPLVVLDHVHVEMVRFLLRVFVGYYCTAGLLFSCYMVIYMILSVR